MTSPARGLARRYIGEMVYGANDGIITTFAVVAGASGANLSSSVIVILGIANLVADGFSMGASSYLAQRSEQDAQGQSTKDAQQGAFKDGLVTFISFVIAGALPLVPFLAPHAAANAFSVSILATAAALFFVGSLRSVVTRKSPLTAGFEMLTVGGIAAAIAYGIGAWVEGVL